MSKNRIVFIIGLLALIWPLAGGAQEGPPQDQSQGKALSLTLNDTIARALKNNLGVRAAVLSPQVAEAALAQAGEKYYPTLSFSYARQDNANASYSFLDATGNYTTKGNNYSSSISQQIPFGGQFSVSVTGGMTDTTQRAVTINPRYNGQLRFNFSQPLLQGFGYTASQFNILIARNSYDSSELQFYKTVQDTVYSATQAYWGLVYSIENLKVQRLALQLAKELLVQNQHSVEIGTLAPMDILSAQSEVANREASIIAAEAAVKNSEDQMKTLINLSPEEEKGLTSIATLDQPAYEEMKVDLDQALALAMQKRPDLKISQIGLKTQDLSLSNAKNQLLPNLNFNASYWSPGVAGTQILYDNPLFGNVIGRVPGSASQAMKDAFNFKYKNWSLGLSLSIPLSNMISRAAVAQAQLNQQQAILNLKNQEQQVVLEIKTAVRNVQTTYQQVQSYKVARELAEQKLQAEQEKLRVGQSTNYFVLQYQRDLTNARVLELNAIINYNLAQVALDRSTGTILEKKNIKISEINPQ